MSETSNTDTPATPWHLWVIAIVALLWSAGGALDYVMTQTKNEEYMSMFTDEQRAFAYGFPAWVVAFWAISVWGGVLGAVLLLLRKRAAFPVFLVSWVAMVITTFQIYVLSNALEVFGSTGELIFNAVIFLVALALVFYARAMSRRGVLR